MSETTAPPAADVAAAPPEVAADPNAATAAPEAAAEELAPIPKLDIRTLLECGVHFGHQTRRWNPQMRDYIFGERNGTHILDLDQTLPMFQEALDFVRDLTAQGGKVLFVGTKRQASEMIEAEARRAGQFYVSNRWLGGMLTNWKTVKKSLERYKHALKQRDDEEEREKLSKKELARATRLCEKYRKSLEGITEMARVPDAIFIIDVMKEEIAVSEARRLELPIIAVVDSNCNPKGVDYLIPGNDDAIRAIDLYCKLVAQACIEGEAEYQNRIITDESAAPSAEAAPAAAAPGGRRVVEIKQAPRRGRGQAGGRTHTSGGWAEREGAEEGAAAEGEAAAPAAAPDAAAGTGEKAPDLAASARNPGGTESD
jgi:small subunit ribosomal protein S2